VKTGWSIPAASHAEPGNLTLEHGTKLFRVLIDVMVDEGISFGRYNGLQAAVMSG
jgi:hypothetical protein